MKIRYIGTSNYQEYPVTGTNALWQPQWVSDVSDSRATALVALGTFVYEDDSTYANQLKDRAAELASLGIELPLTFGNGRQGGVDDGTLMSYFTADIGLSRIFYDAANRIAAENGERKSPLVEIWAPEKVYALGTKVFPSAILDGGNTASLKAFIVTTAGTSGTVEPTWATAESGTTTDGTVTWTARNIYFIKPSIGSDANDGSQASPFASFTPLSTGNLLSVAGRTFLIERGQTLAGRVPLAGGSGLANWPTHIMATGRGSRPVLDTRGLNNNCANMSGKTWITFDSLEVKSDYATGPVFDMTSGSSACQVSNCKIDGGKWGIDLSSYSTAVSNHTIDGNEFLNQTQASIYGNAVAAHVSGLTITNNFTDGLPGNFVQLISGGTSGSPTAFAFQNPKIKKNRAYNCTGDVIVLACNNPFVDAGRPLDPEIEENDIQDAGKIGIELEAVRATTSRVSAYVKKNNVQRCCKNETTGNIHLEGCSGVLITRNVSDDARTTAAYDGCNIYLDCNPYPEGRPCVDCEISFNLCTNAKSWGYAGDSWFERSPTSFNSNGPSSGIRLLKTLRCYVHDNLCFGNGSGIWFEDMPLNNRVERNVCIGNLIGIGFRDMADRSNVPVNNIIRYNRFNLFQVEPGIFGNSPALTLRNYADTANLAANPGEMTQVTINAASSLFQSGVNGIIGYGGGFIRYKYVSATKAKGMVMKPIVGGPAISGAAYQHFSHVDQYGVADGNIVSDPTNSGANWGGTGADFGNGM